MHEDLATKGALKDLEARFDGFSTIEHIALLKNWFLPKIERFAGMIDEFEASNENVRQIIR